MIGWWRQRRVRRRYEANRPLAVQPTLAGIDAVTPEGTRR